MKPRLKVTVRRAALACVASAVALVLAELVIRAAFGDRFAPRPAFTVQDRQIIKRLTPNLDDVFHGADFTMQIRTDDFGVRLGERGPIDYESADVVLVVGDSNVFSWGVETDDALVSALDVLCRERPRLRAVNLGVGGYGSLQAVEGLRRFLAATRVERVRGVIFLHITNDCTDNEVLLLFQHGFMDFTPKAAASLQGNRSPLHALNLLRQLSASAAGAGSGTGGGGAGDAAFVDVLQTTGVYYTDKKPAAITLPSGLVVDPDHEIFDRRAHRGRIRRLYSPREEVSELQQHLLQLAVDRLGEVVAELGIPVIHTVRSPNLSFTRAVETSVARSPRRGNLVQFREIPGPAEPPRNPHSGGHYTPAYNRFLASVFFEWLRPYL